MTGPVGSVGKAIVIGYNYQFFFHRSRIVHSMKHDKNFQPLSTRRDFVWADNFEIKEVAIGLYQNRIFYPSWWRWLHYIKLFPLNKVHNLFLVKQRRIRSRFLGDFHNFTLNCKKKQALKAAIIKMRENEVSLFPRN